MRPDPVVSVLAASGIPFSTRETEVLLLHVYVIAETGAAVYFATVEDSHANRRALGVDGER